VRTLIRSIVVLLLSADALFSSFDEGMAPYCPEPRHPVDIRFYVDNKNLLNLPYLEITMPGDGFRKSVVKVRESNDEKRAEGYLATTLPDGEQKIVTCALVACPERDLELMCGEVTIPQNIPIDRIHEITYSTAHACQEQPAKLARFK